jgi:hypothetical protein
VEGGVTPTRSAYLFSAGQFEQTPASAADIAPGAARPTWDPDRGSRQRISRLPPFTRAASACASGGRDHLLSGCVQSSIASQRPSGIAADSALLPNGGRSPDGSEWEEVSG